MRNRITGPADLERLLEYLKQHRGFDFTAYKRTTLSRRIEKRMAEVGITGYANYGDYLEVHPEEFVQLFNTILINVTSFFRDRDSFDYIAKDVIPSILQSKPEDEQIRVWSAGCASGEECYSAAMLLAEAMGPDAFRDRVKIYATDVDDEELNVARHATYPERRLEDVPDDLRTKYFDRTGTRYTFRKEYRRSVIFGRHDLLEDAPISRVDLLLCRNTLMYFNQEAQSRIVSRFQFALRDGGYLVLGKAEMLLNYGATFEPVDLRLRIFVKASPPAAEAWPSGAAPARDDRPAPASAHRLRDIAFDQDPTAQAIVDHEGRLLAANLRARELFGLNPRDVGRPLQDLELSYRPVELRSCIEDAHARRQVVQLRDVTWPTAAGESRFFHVQVTPVIDAADAPLGTKILFVDVTRQHELQDELQRSRQELETAYEELQSTNEELETTNEELQSTNEELETMNEELQSTNEELEAVNEELRQRGADLSRINLFLGGILRHVPLGVVVMNTDLEVELWNDVASDMWGLRRDEVQGRYFLSLDIGLPVEQLRQPLLSVLQVPDRIAEQTLAATNRRGRPVTVHGGCASAGGPSEQGSGLIVLMQELDAEDRLPRTH